ncbi:MAG: ATP synthase F1 subunit epsilon [Bacteroidales bacterium]|nr:ATP synthase F1 subunit epsilon [Bacteroidales bacterium]MDE6802262.1 ATP synthase F1 subunit epsilon [Muribaculaceae bacterium]MDE6831602.1 ATP synthase F1 subunit epsilon [Muribaculaceae bacterium]
MTLNIISAQSIVFSGEVKSVTLPGAKGRFTVLRDHASLISTLVKGDVVYTDADGQHQTAAIDGGIVSVDNNVISVCVA